MAPKSSAKGRSKAPKSSAKGRSKGKLLRGRQQLLKTKSADSSEAICQFNLGFEKCCAKVWDLFRTEGILVAAGLDDSKFKRDLKACAVGRPVMAYSPASHGGSGLLGFGIVTSPLEKFITGDSFVEGQMPEKVRKAMAEIFSDPDNKGMFKRKTQNFNSQYKNHTAVKQSKAGSMSLWERGQSFTSREQWQRFVRAFPRRWWKSYWQGFVQVQWQATVPFELGVKHLKCSGFQLSTMRAVTLRYPTKSQKQAILAALSMPTAKMADARADVDGPSASDAPNASCVVMASTVGPPASAGHVKAAMPCSSSQDIQSFLSCLQLQQFAPKMLEEQIDMESLRLLSDQDLMSIGLPMGPRRKLQAALASARVSS